MELPKIDLPTYELKIPSTGDEIKVRPFIVKEEKLLLMAAESKDLNNVVNTTLQVIRNCILDDDVKLNQLPFFDVDYLFIALRAKSVGEKVVINFRCRNPVNGTQCGNVFPVDIDVTNCEVKGMGKNDLIKIAGDTTVKMKYPTYAMMKVIDASDNVLEKKIKIISGCIDTIYRGSEAYSAKDFSRDDLRGFVEGLTDQQLKKLEEFTGEFPSFVIKGEGTCPKCGFNHHVEYKDFESFFT